MSTLQVLEVNMKTRVQKWGNSLALRIPRSFAVEAGLHADAAVELSLVKGKLVVEPVTQEPLTLEQLFATSPTKTFLASGTLGRQSVRRSGETQRRLCSGTRGCCLDNA
jgi:antitoxin MazE